MLRREEVENQKHVKTQIEENSEKLKKFNDVVADNKLIRAEFQIQSDILKKVRYNSRDWVG